jgi:hypothetical protein
MPDSLDRVKDQLRQAFLGKAGIHGFGISRANRAIRVYVATSPDAAVLDQLRQAAAPYDVLVVKEDRPQVTRRPG